MNSHSPMSAGEPVKPEQGGADALETLLTVVESELSEIGQALRRRDAASVEGHAMALRDALHLAVDGFSRAAKAGAVPPLLRNRLVRAGGQVAEQRDALARATFALDHAIDALLPKQRAAVYGKGRGKAGADATVGRYSA